jgi:hypothetical protein
MFVKVMAAPGTEAPLESLKRPVISPNVWPKTAPAASASSAGSLTHELTLARQPLKFVTSSMSNLLEHLLPMLTEAITWRRTCQFRT